jgi:hypothetical protein
MPRRFTIGRDGRCDVPIADDSVSRIHAEIWLAEDGSLFMADRGSSNGTTILRAGQSFPLKQDVVLPGDQVRFGGVTLTVSDVISAVEIKNPGALTPRAAPSPGAAHPAGSPAAPLPPPRMSPPPPPPPPPPIANSAPPPAPGWPPVPGRAGQLIRCECGAIKTIGQPCPGCNR